ncbi:ABC-type hemin transport system, ATPase component [Marinobacterium lacunae]|uniref:ABC-type hemin transport system, ATPase component n=1 Tax=Marinobacterium lacunae TaxID=1232683 RepID=A0A081G286_9GAMM|nr:ATP-binding cassette domain-containing protein [Marinobacterium lacunae]KEA64891.1 ABC-type hemin transport system, ATPase component [Marinobacterium lacunae]
MLEAIGVAHDRGASRRLEAFDLRLKGGELSGVLGPNGAGKSTLVALLSGLLEPSAGELRLKGLLLSRYTLRERARHMTVMLQRQPLDFAFSVRDVIAMGSYPLDLPLPDLDRRIEELAQGLDLEHLLSRNYLSLSGGEAQRAQLARVLVQRGCSPSVILLDEPLSALDLRHQHQALALIRTLAQREGHAVLMVLHDLNLASRYADAVLLLGKGALVEQGRTAEVMQPNKLSALFEVPIERYQTGDGLGVFTSNAAPRA